MIHTQDIRDTMRRRYSCRTYRNVPLTADDRSALEDYIKNNVESPFGSKMRFILTAASPGDDAALKGLGTYGVIRNPAAFIIGVLDDQERGLEDFGYLMEKNILRATAMGLGSCWLGGTFSRSSFAAKTGAGNGSILPAVAAIGYRADRRSAVESFSRYIAKSDTRRPWERIFFHEDSRTPLERNAAGGYGGALEMLRIAPSASNKQPWRVIMEGDAAAFHMFLCRTGNYGRNLKVMGMADLQRVDMGIAMSHFDLGAREEGLAGSWAVQPSVPSAPDDWEYVASWRG